jgi:hypothetical protein
MLVLLFVGFMHKAMHPGAKLIQIAEQSSSKTVYTQKRKY